MTNIKKSMAIIVIAIIAITVAEVIFGHMLGTYWDGPSMALEITRVVFAMICVTAAPLLVVVLVGKITEKKR